MEISFTLLERHFLTYFRNIFFTTVLMLSSVVFGQTTYTVINPTSPWSVPANVDTVIVQAWGGGGGGGGAKSHSNGSAGGGGGGGAFSKQTLLVSVGQNYTITYGSGGAGGNGGTPTAGTTGGTTTFTGPGGTCSAVGGGGGAGSNGVSGAAGGAGGSSGTGFMYSGGYGAVSLVYGSYDIGGGGGGGAGNAGAGSNATPGTTSATPSTGGAGGIGNPNAAPYKGGTGGTGNLGINGNNGASGAAPGGGGAGGNAWTGSSYSGGAGGAGQVVITYTVDPTCTQPCQGWITPNCTTCVTGCYIDAGTVTPTSILQTASTATSTSNYGYIFWNFNASAGATYYFDLCSSTGTAGVSWLRLHNSRTAGNNYCMNLSSTPTKVLENIENGCLGTGTGLSKLIWTCQTSGTYYLETAVGLTMNYWGVQGNQTTVLSYKTLPSFTIVNSSDVFYDKGIDGINGSSNSYNNNEDWIHTYYCTDTVSSAISAQFIAFSTSPGDILCVYDGNSINAPIIGCYSGPSITGAFSSTASDGSLTFQFTSGDNGVSNGWQANISCIENVSVRNNSSAKRIGIYPNPVKDKLEVSGLGLDTKTEIRIFNVIGERVYIDYSSTKLTLDVTALPSGIYFIQIENETSIWNGRFVKE